MSLGKKDISKNISTKTHVSFKVSEKILNSFLELLKKKSLSKTLKISKFGTFDRKLSPARIGRNPKSKEEFVIKERLKLNFKSSKNVKNILN
jgi:integration host factor subunit alpha